MWSASDPVETWKSCLTAALPGRQPLSLLPAAPGSTHLLVEGTLSVAAAAVVVEGEVDTRTAAEVVLMDHTAVDTGATAVETAPLCYQLLPRTVEAPTY